VTAGSARIGVLVVCLGNICRSPTAEAVLRHKLGLAGLATQVRVDSAGTGGWHVGEAPDPRSQRHAARRGFDLSALRARRISEDDFHRFDHVLAMDEDNLAELKRWQPAGARAELRLFGDRSVPDPYLGGAEGFERVLDLVEAAADQWVVHLRQQASGLV